MRMFGCVCVCGEWDHYSFSRQKYCTPRSLDSGLSRPGGIRIEAHQEYPLVSAKRMRHALPV